MKTNTITRAGMLMAAALAVQLMHLPAFITGVAVNAVLIVAAVYTGLAGGMVIGCITPLVALGLGIVHPAAAALVPVIATANCTLVLVFRLLMDNNHYIALITASLGKFLVFFTAIHSMLPLLGVNLPAPVLAAFQLPQLFTAITGGLAGIAAARYLPAETPPRIS